MIFTNAKRMIECVSRNLCKDIATFCVCIYFALAGAFFHEIYFVALGIKSVTTNKSPVHVITHSYIQSSGDEKKERNVN